jgi:hypothetical protein
MKLFLFNQTSAVAGGGEGAAVGPARAVRPDLTDTGRTAGFRRETNHSATTCRRTACWTVGQIGVG